MIISKLHNKFCFLNYGTTKWYKKYEDKTEKKYCEDDSQKRIYYDCLKMYNNFSKILLLEVEVEQIYKSYIKIYKEIDDFGRTENNFLYFIIYNLRTSYSSVISR